MKPEDVYEQWKQHAASIKAPDGFATDVMAAVNQSDTDQPTFELPAVAPRSASLFDHPAWATVAVLAASLMGLMRVAFALLIGIW